MATAFVGSLVHDYLRPAVPGATMKRVVEAAGDAKVRVQEMLPILDANPPYARFLLMQSFLSERVARWAEEDPENPDQEHLLLDRALALLGKSAVRNVVVATRLGRAAGSGLPRRKSEPLGVSPKDQLRFGIQAEAFCEDQKIVQPEIAFQAGIHYDWIYGLVARSRAVRDCRMATEEAFKEGLAMAHVAYELGVKQRAIQHGKYVFGAALLCPLGKALMMALFPKTMGDRSWAGFLTACEKYRNFKRDAFRILEKRRFPMGHAQLSSVFASFFGFFRPVEKAIRFYEEPYLLRTADPNLFQLSMILSIAAALRAADGALESQHRDWLRGAGIRDKDLEGILARTAPPKDEEEGADA
jgi:hypothetical protein